MASFRGKFNRQYVLKIETGPNEYVEINSKDSPLTLEFTIVRNNLAAANTATLVVHNLSPSNRAKIVKDICDINFETQRAVQLFAGYNDGETAILPLVFNGIIRRAYSERNMVDFVTQIEASDSQAAMVTGNVSVTLPPGLKTSDLIEKLVKLLPGVESSTIGKKFIEGTKRATPVVGNPMQILNQLTNNGLYFENQNAYALDQFEVILGDVRLINYDNGLLGTPRKMETLVDIEMLFEPRIKPSQLIQLYSDTAERFDGLYKVTAITHRGVISGAVGGDCRTNLSLQQLDPGYTYVIDKATDEWRVVGA
jgi:hypothetical protein